MTNRNSVTTCPSCKFPSGVDDRYCGACGTSLEDSASPSREDQPHSGLTYPENQLTSKRSPEVAISAQDKEKVLPASFLRRLTAWLVDFALVGGVFVSIAVVQADTTPQWRDWPDFVTWAFLALPASVVYRPVMWRMNRGKTLGQEALQIRVLGPDGMPISEARGIWRVMATWIIMIACALGALILVAVALCSMLWNHERRTWFDRFSDTRVVAATE